MLFSEYLDVQLSPLLASQDPAFVFRTYLFTSEGECPRDALFREG